MTKREYKSDPDKPSKMFMEVMYNSSGVGSDEMTCEWCERTHLCPDNEYAERDEMDFADYKKYCEEEKEQNPDGVVLHYNCDSISGREINGINFVLECPCNGLTRFENFIWNDRDIIRRYLKVKIEQEYQWAEQELTKNKLAGIDKPPRYEY